MPIKEHADTHTHTHTRAQAHAHTHTHTHTYTHTHTMNKKLQLYDPKWILIPALAYLYFTYHSREKHNSNLSNDNSNDIDDVDHLLYLRMKREITQENILNRRVDNIKAVLFHQQKSVYGWCDADMGPINPLAWCVLIKCMVP